MLHVTYTNDHHYFSFVCFTEYLSLIGFWLSLSRKLFFRAAKEIERIYRGIIFALIIGSGPPPNNLPPRLNPYVCLTEPTREDVFCTTLEHVSPEVGMRNESVSVVVIIVVRGRSLQPEIKFGSVGCEVTSTGRNMRRYKTRIKWSTSAELDFRISKIIDRCKSSSRGWNDSQGKRRNRNGSKLVTRYIIIIIQIGQA